MPGTFLDKLREHLGSEDFDEKIEEFLECNASKVVCKTSEGKVSSLFSLSVDFFLP